MLFRDGMLSLRTARESRVHCVSGLLWVTQDKRVTDLVLKPGETFVSGHQDVTFIIALEDSHVLLERKGLSNRVGRMIERVTRR